MLIVGAAGMAAGFVLAMVIGRSIRQADIEATSGQPPPAPGASVEY